MVDIFGNGKSERREPVLRDNRWIPGGDELAVFFGVESLSGLFVKTLHVPATSRAYILQGGKATEVPQGEYEIEGFFARLNNLLRDQHAEILVTRSAALPVEFSFEDLETAEHLRVGARFTLGVKIESVPAFAQHFMLTHGVVTTGQLAELLAPSVRQLAAEFVASQSLRDMARNKDLRPQLDERLHSALKARFSQFGLAIVQVETLELRHDKFDANRTRVGSLWMVADERHAQLEHSKQLDQLYNDEEWQKLWREEQDGRVQFRRKEIAQDEAVADRELALKRAQRMQEIRVREIDLYGRILESQNKQQAIDKGAGEILAALEHEMAKKHNARRDDASEWAHLRQMAQLRMRTELEAAQQDLAQARTLDQQRFGHVLLQQQVRNKIEQALLIEDEARKRRELARLHDAEHAIQRRGVELEEERHRGAVQTLVLAHAAQRREAERIQEWEDAQAGNRVAATQHEKLLRTIEAEAAHGRALQDVQIEGEERRASIKRQDQEAQWQQELAHIAASREGQAARWKAEHEALLAQQSHEITRMETMGGLDDTAKLALAAGPNAAALADYMKTQVHADMSPEQLQALSGVVAATNSVSPQDASRQAAELAREQAARRDTELDKDRRHQSELLASQAALAVGMARAPAQPVCPNGHAVGSTDKFCAQCGAALHA